MQALIFLAAARVFGASAAVAAIVPAGDAVRDAVARSDIFIGQPNVLAAQAMPLGNGRLGAALWAADGLTVQLNRIDTLPYRRSPGWVSLPDLTQMTADRGFRGRLNLYDGSIEESGGGVTLRAYIEHDADRLVLDMAGLRTDRDQRIRLALWEPRRPSATIDADTVILAENWRDDELPGGSGRPFGSLAAVRAVGREAKARMLDSRTLEIAARPDADGRLRILIAAPPYDGTQSATDLARGALLRRIDDGPAQAWWHAFWHRALLVRAESADGIGRYSEALRTLFLYSSAAHNGGTIPGSQGGSADLFSAARDEHSWDPAAFWTWNLRAQVGANLAAGVPELNAPFFALFRDNLDAIERWTRAHMGGRPGICVPETMRFNGNGVEFESARLRPFPIVTHSCDLGWSSTSNARTLTTGAEIALWAWRTWQQTGDRSFLERNYPLIAEAARFLLAYQSPDSAQIPVRDGLLHTSPSNAHETQHDVVDPATDIAAIRALYPAAIAAARLLDRDKELSVQLGEALKRTPPLPQMAAPLTTTAEGLTATNAAGPVFAASYRMNDAYRNAENIGLEAVWPYEIIGFDDPLFDIARRTYALRPFRYRAAWSFDPVQAARLGLGADMSQSLYWIAQLHQVFPNGMSGLGFGLPEFSIEHASVAALALSQALAQEHGDTVRVAPALPPGWTMSGSVAISAGRVVSVDVAAGMLVGFSIRTRDAGSIRFETPWRHQPIVVFRNGKRIAVLESASASDGRFELRLDKTSSYRFVPANTTTEPVFPPSSAATVKQLDRAAIGLDPPCCAPPTGYTPANDRNASP